MTHGCKAPAAATAARAHAPAASAAVVIFRMVRRSTRSLTGPASRGSSMIGTEKHRPSRPSASAEWVRTYRTHSLATLLIWVPMLDTIEPAHSRTNSGQRRAGGNRPRPAGTGVQPGAGWSLGLTAGRPPPGTRGPAAPRPARARPAP